MQDDEFEWDDEKARSNLVKHGVSFEAARDAFNDPDAVENDDPDPDEDRFGRICQRGRELYTIVYTEPGDRIRILSARKANRHEQRTYREG